MAISPVSSVSFNRNNMATNIAFEGKKNKGENHRGMTNTLRAVPLAALIAMSPMVNVNGGLALDNNAVKTENVYGTDGIEQTPFAPLPSRCKVLKNVNITYDTGGYTGFSLIDSDMDGNDYEMIEYKHVGYDGKVIQRGILKAALFVENNKTVYISGILLDKNDLSNYYPQGMMQDMFNSENFYNLIKATISLPENNHAIYELPQGRQYVGRDFYTSDLESYKIMLGIK